MKIGQIEKFIEAREDPSFVQAMQVKELSSEQSEMQVQLRHAMQATESQLEELETALAVFKRDTSSDSSKKANGDPVVERIQRSVRAVDTALQERLQTIDELSRRIDAIRVSTPTKTRPISTGHLGTPSRKPPTSVSFNPPPEVLREIHLQVSAEGCKPAWLAGMKVARLSRPGSNEKKASIPASLASGPVKINSLHPPGQLPKGVQASVKAELRPNESQDGSEAEEKPSIPPSTPEETKPKSSPPSSIPTAESPSFGFGGIKISLDPGQVVTSATSRTSRPGGGSHRAHVPAAQLRQTSGSGTPSSPTAGFSFNLPAESPKETKKGTPSGFFSLSGFDQK
ncbi:hypothetical protein BCR39DRAFT_342959 [Naematelia encephala]|uniref:Uncharacterized protein n=1 Tax=Naematelia encephala TaxID=71784 RepID=A0A1Y2AMV1_9TREE|nr:hypothetical protein BCR39DRAFT_342959 [Naematelia encephala]